jgi:hypothetical protein
MRYLIITVVVAAAVWFFLFRNEPPPEAAPPPPPSPRKQFEMSLASKPVDAEQLVQLCERYPQVAAEVLKNRQFLITGTVRDIRLAGMDARRAEVMLYGGGKKRAVISFDLDKYMRLNASDERGQGRYVIYDTELFFIKPGGVGKKLVFAKETTVKQLVATKSVGETNVSFSAVGGPTR